MRELPAGGESAARAAKGGETLKLYRWLVSCKVLVPYCGVIYKVRTLWSIIMSEANAPQQRADQAAGTIEALTKQIQQLKAQRDAVILAHYYVPPEVQDVADYVGDSFALAKLAVDLPQQTIVLCGVEFMGESAKLLNPEKRVLLPEPGADCPMAHMVRKADIDRVRAEHRRPCRSVLRQLHGRGENVVGRVRDLVKRREDLPRAAAAQHPVHP